jgi:type VI secretion system secreted protein Hcp
MAGNGFLTFFEKADGESTKKGKEKWVEILDWSWEIEAETSWTKGGGASVGKPNPGTISWAHTFDTTSTVIMGYICTGRAFPKAEVQMTRSAGGAAAQTFFTMRMGNVYITKAGTSATPDGQLFQQVEMVFKSVEIEYKPQDPRTGKPGPATKFSWDIVAGTASP